MLAQELPRHPELPTFSTLPVLIIDTLSTFYCRIGNRYFAVFLAVAPGRAVPVLLRLRGPGETVAFGGPGEMPWSLMVCKAAERA